MQVLLQNFMNINQEEGVEESQVLLKINFKDTIQFLHYCSQVLFHTMNFGGFEGVEFLNRDELIKVDLIVSFLKIIINAQSRNHVNSLGEVFSNYYAMEEFLKELFLESLENLMKFLLLNFIETQNFAKIPILESFERLTRKV
jgi:hypothetical protein